MDEHIRAFVELMDCDDGLECLPVDDDLKLGLMRLARNTPTIAKRGRAPERPISD